MTAGGQERKRADKSVKRSYRAPQRQAAADRTREAILTSAKRVFEERGWSGTTMRAIAEAAGVSQKTVEAIYGTKASLLEAVVAFAIRGDSDGVEMPRRPAIAEMEAAPDAAAMLNLHAAHLARINPRSADIAWVVEQQQQAAWTRTTLGADEPQPRLRRPLGHQDAAHQTPNRTT